MAAEDSELAADRSMTVQQAFWGVRRPNSCSLAGGPTAVHALEAPQSAAVTVTV
jgi:hypothetical protein